MRPIILDTGALIAVDRRHRTLLGLLDRAVRDDVSVIVPVGCLAQVWREPARQARLGMFLKTEVAHVVDLTRSDAQQIGLLLARYGGRDVVDAHVALCAIRTGGRVITSDPTDLARYLPPDKVRTI